MNKHTHRGHRHRANQVIKHGPKSVRPHIEKGGRSGRVRAKRTPSDSAEYHVFKPNPPYQPH
jgi:hypothetical protein